MGGLDAIVFTAGVGENSLILENWYVRIWNSSGLEIDEEEKIALGLKK